MSTYYHPNRTRNLFDPQQNGSGPSSLKKPFRISRTKIDLFLNCPRCFYLDRRLGIAQPPGYPFALNSAVDKLLKKEFDSYRARGLPHPLMETFGIDAIPLAHERLNEWRDALRGGITALHRETNLLIAGGVDDVWINPNGETIVVDYKSTSKDQEVSLDANWQISYKRQMEIYQWLFRQNGFKVSPTGYFVYCNGKTDKESFDRRLEFDIKLIPYKGDDSWIDQTILDLHKCLLQEGLPEPDPDCDFCRYRHAAYEFENA